MPAARPVLAALTIALAATTVPLATPPAATATVAPARSTQVQADLGPVVIVPGTLASDPIVEIELRSLADALRADGYEPFTYYLPGGGTGDMRATAAALPAFVDGVLAQTGATEIDIVGHSQGGLLARYYIRFLGGAAAVDNLVSLGTPHQGTALANLGSLFGLWNCLGFGACTQAAVGSQFLAELNDGDDTAGDVRYTSFATKLDLIVLPYTNAFLTGDGTTNVAVQDQCPLRLTEHLTFPQDGTVYSGIVDALAGAPITLDCLAL